MSSAVIAQTRARRQLSWMLAPVALALMVAGVLALFGSTDLALKLLGVVVLLVGVLLAMMVAGLRRQVAAAERHLAELELDAAILAANPGCGEACTTCVTDDCAVKTLRKL